MLVLFETAAGFALFKVLQEGRLQQVDDLSTDFETPEKAKKLITLKKFSPFNNTADALKSATALIESKLSKSLKKFLKKEIVDKKLNEKLAVSDPKLGGAILDKLGIQCTHDKAVAELFRGIRSQIENLVTELSGTDYNAMSLGLSHSLSRYKLKFSPDKVDTMIVQAIALLDDLDKELNTYSMRVREWYGWHFPELSKVIPDNLLYTKSVKRMGSRTNAATTDFSDFLPEELIPELREAAMISMGTEVSEEDIQNITELCDQVISIAQYREQLYEYLKNRMQAIAPNLTILVGELVGARLIAHAGSLLSLAKHPASTVQILGAEKALFRALKTKHATPKYGLIYHASLIGQAPPKYKGKIARLVGAKAALACRYDALGEGETNTDIGSDSRAKIELRIRNLDAGQTHRISGTGKGKQTKKYDQKEALSNVTSGHYKASNDVVTPDKSAKKRKNQEANNIQEEEVEEAQEEPRVEKREKKKKKTQQHLMISPTITTFLICVLVTSVVADSREKVKSFILAHHTSDPFDLLTEDELQREWSHETDINIFERHHFQDNIPVHVKLVGFDDEDGFTNITKVDLLRYLNSLSFDDTVGVIHPLDQGQQHQLLIRKNFIFQVSKLDKQITSQLRNTIAAFQTKGLTRIPVTEINKIIENDFKKQQQTSYTLYIMKLSNTDEIYQYYETTNAPCGTSIYVDPRQRFMWLDISTKQSSYGPHSFGEGMVAPFSIPNVRNYDMKVPSQQAKQTLLVDIVSFIEKTCDFLLGPSFHFFPAPFATATTNTTQLLLIVIHDHAVSPDMKKDLFDWQNIQSKIQQVTQLSGQSVLFKRVDLSLMTCIYCDAAFSYSIKYAQADRQKAERYLDSVELHFWLQKFHKQIANEHLISGMLTVPIYLFDVSESELLLLDKQHQSVAFSDMIVAIQTQSGYIFTDMSCDLEPLWGRSDDATKSVLGSVLSTGWGVAATYPFNFFFDTVYLDFQALMKSGPTFMAEHFLITLGLL